MGGEQGSNTTGRKTGSKERGGKGSREQQTKLHGLLITKVGGRTSGGKLDFRCYIDTLLFKIDSHNEKIIPFSNLFLFLRYNKRGSLSLVQVCLYDLWIFPGS